MKGLRRLVRRFEPAPQEVQEVLGLQREAVEIATQGWVSWFAHPCRLKPLGYTPPTETDVKNKMQLSSQAMPG